MFIVMRVLGKKPCEVRAMQIAHEMKLTGQDLPEDAARRRLVAGIKSYLRFARPHLAQRCADGALFPSGGRMGQMCPQAWRNRWNRAVPTYRTAMHGD